MNIKVRKALSDLRMNPGRTALVVLALVIGLWGMGSLMVSATILRNDLQQNFVMTRPPHAILTSREFDRLDVAAFSKRAEVEGVEFRDLSLQRIEVYPNVWIPLWLLALRISTILPWHDSTRRRAVRRLRREPCS